MTSVPEAPETLAMDTAFVREMENVCALLAFMAQHVKSVMIRQSMDHIAYMIATANMEIV